ncbi:MAG: efflux RND transporter periplasmic adaptor subunit [Pyrinomonadaceae bacterium]|nr:efflux RND transporter periplasmic adaptor subunit [Pyrinomonadaceae bacterium]
MFRLSSHWFDAAIKLTLFVVVASFAAGCGSSSANNAAATNSSNTAAEDAPIPITTARAESRAVPAFVQATGSLVADEVSNIAPKVAGKISNISVNIGDFVSQGAVIAKIDDRDARLELAARQAAVKQSQVAVRQAEARLGLGPKGSFNASSIPEVRAANSAYELARAELRQAETNEKRYRELVESGDVAMITYEQYRLVRDTAQARVNTAKEQLDAQINAARQNNEQIRSAEAAVEAARTAVQIAEQGVADTVIRAPFAGFISAREVAVGEFVSTATVIATLLRTNPIKIQMQVAEADVPSIGLGRGVSLEVEAYPGRRFSGVVTAINPAVDATSRSAIVEASIENGDNALRSGMFATARVTKEGGSTGIFIPKSAVYNHAPTQSYRAFVIENGVAKLKVIQLGTEEGDSYQILSGIEAEQMVATSNLDQLYEGAKVAQ